MSKTKFILDRLTAALEAKGVALKRHAILDIAAAAFGYRNQNAFTAAVAKDSVQWPEATANGHLSLPGGETLTILRDPVSGAPFAIDQSFLAHLAENDDREGTPAYVVSPYGHIVNVAPALDDTISDKATCTQPAGRTITVWTAIINHKHGCDSYTSIDEADLYKQVAEYCADYWSDTGLSNSVLKECANDKEIIKTYFDAMIDGRESVEIVASTLNLPQVF